MGRTLVATDEQSNAPAVAVIGHEVAQRQGLTLGSKFKATHGMPAEGQTPDEHDNEWEVVGVLKPTQTANDRVLFAEQLIPIVARKGLFFAICDHQGGWTDKLVILYYLNYNLYNLPDPVLIVNVLANITK